MYDILFIGGGLNYAGAIVASKKGLKCAVIEKDLAHIGGTCLNNGCIPSKYFLHLSKTILHSKNEAISGSIHINLKKAQKHKNEKIAASHKAIEMQLKASGVEIIEGEGFLVDSNKVEVNGKIYEAKYIVIGTGSHPRELDFAKIDGKNILNSDDILNLKEFPKSIAIYGSGAIGLEMATFLAINGVDVTLIFRHEHISNKFHPNIVEIMEKNLENLGIKLLKNTSITKVETKDKVIINESIEVEKLLIAIGRVPNTDVIKTDKIKISKGIETDEFFETSLKGHYAIGDCNGKLLLAHAARAEVLNVIDSISGKKEILNLNNIPKFIYTLPQSYASIGIKSKKETIFPLKALGLSNILDEDGLVVVYADEDNFITGAEILSPNAEEIIGIFSEILAGEMDKKTALKAIFPHPTFSESVDRVLRRIK